MKIEELAKRVDATVESNRKIQYGIQYSLSRGSDKAIVNVYHGRKGTRIVVQGKGPLVEELHEAVGETAPRPSLPAWTAWCGTDEAGKGDYFGPLCVAGVAVSRKEAEALQKVGVRDSKTMSERTVFEHDQAIRRACRFELRTLMPEEYNARQIELGNLNLLLGELHADVIATLSTKSPELQAAVTDQFGNPRYVRDPLGKRRAKIELVQRPKADETDVAAAAASILARNAFLEGLDKLKGTFDMRFPPGASSPVIAAARAFVKRHGRERLGEVAKLHFKTTASL